MSLTESLKKSLRKTFPNSNESTFDLHIRNTQKLYQDVFRMNFNPKQKKIPWRKIEKYFDEKDYSITTRANYYSSLFNIYTAINFDKKITESIKKMRDKYKQQYKEIDDGLKSKKQEDNFVSAKLLNGFIDDYTKQIKDGSDDIDLIQIWMILKLLREFYFRNEIATLEFVSLKDYNKIKKAEEHTTRNMIVMDKKDLWFISKNKYKTQKIYGEELIDVDGEILKDLKKYRKIVGHTDSGMLFKSLANKSQPSNALSKYLTNWSKKNLPPLVKDDGSKKPRSLSTTMIVKAYQSDKQGENKKELKKDSKNRGNQPQTMMETYVSTQTPQI